MHQITATIQLPCTLTEALARLTPDSVVCVCDVTATPRGITDYACVAHAVDLGFGDASLGWCMWQLPTYRHPVYTPTKQLRRIHNGYVWSAVSTAPRHEVAADQVRHSIPRALADVLDRVAVVAQGANAQMYLVGGAVRSVLQSAPVTDLDVAMNGDMAALGVALATQLETSIIQRSAFDTETLALPDAVMRDTGVAYLDIVPLRTEVYSHPGALPNVMPTAMIAVDLGRRDLTINAMAIAYRPSVAMPLYDPFGGYDDLLRRRARLLHPLSIIDDPTRVVRLARFIVRLGLTMDDTTRRAVRWAVESGALQRVSRQRWMHEIQHVLDEASPNAVCVLLGRWRVLAHIDQALTHGVYTQVDRFAPEWRIVAMIWRAPLAQLHQFVVRWHEAPKPLRGIVALRQTKRQWRRLVRVAPSRGAAYLRQFDRRLLVHVAYVEPVLAALLMRVDEAQANMPPIYVRGGDLIRLGIAPGPVIGRLLQALTDALLDGTPELASYDAQIAWMHRHAL